MFYHALTGGNTPTEDLSPVLLWENSSPSVEFTAQTVSLDLSDYAGVIVEYNAETSVSNLCSRVYIKKGESNLASGKYTSRGEARAISLSDIGVVFGDAKVDVTSINDKIIPTKIYGVKEYIVEPQIGNLLWTNPAPAASFGAQKISVDLSNAKGVIIEFMISNNTQAVSSRALIYKGERNFGVGYSAEVNANSRNVTAVENDGVTFAVAYTLSGEANTVLIPYKIYAIN